MSSSLLSLFSFSELQIFALKWVPKLPELGTHDPPGTIWETLVFTEPHPGPWAWFAQQGLNVAGGSRAVAQHLTGPETQALGVPSQTPQLPSEPPNPQCEDHAKESTVTLRKGPTLLSKLHLNLRFGQKLSWEM